MILFTDYSKKIVFIVPPKCGNQSIANMLNIKLHVPIDPDLLTDETFTKLIIYRDDIIDRFLSGLNEDILSNSCYNTMDVTLNNYILFLYKCFNCKIPNVNNLEHYLNKSIPVWFGESDGELHDITDINGEFSSHIQSQSYTIIPMLDQINNIKIIELNDLSKITNNDIKYNAKIKCNLDIDLSKITLKYIKLNNIIIVKECLTDIHKSIILKMFNDDRVLITKLIEKFDYY